MQILKLDNMNLRLNCENYIRDLQEKKQIGEKMGTFGRLWKSSKR